MLTLITGSLVLSVLHALIPNHWLPVLAISRKEKWSISQTTSVTLLSGLAHASSTVLLGLAFAFVGGALADTVHHFTTVVAPLVLISLGAVYIYQHHRHKHFHLHAQATTAVSRRRIVTALAIAMFFSPCLEIEAYFLLAGAQGWAQVTLLAVLYTVVTVSGMVIWIRVAYRGVFRLNWHSLEHNAGIISGATLIATGIASFFIH